MSSPSTYQELNSKNVAASFYKCTKWLVEESKDFPNCPYHYFCDSTYLGDYPPIVDLLAFIFTVSSYLFLLYCTLLYFTASDANYNIIRSKKRYLLPSGPLSFPIALLILSKGIRINTLFPLSTMGPAIIHIIHTSALAFEYSTNDRSVRYAILEASTVSGIVHASLYLDSITMPYYTGLDAMTNSMLSGDCDTCVCRSKALAVGGEIVKYKAWTKSTMLVVLTMFLRMMSRAVGEDKVVFVKKVKAFFEGFSWMSIAVDVYYLMVDGPNEDVALPLTEVVYGGVFVLVLLNVLRKVECLCFEVVRCFQIGRKIGLWDDIV